jgi:uncharacterized damage-inducible protein DinB
MTVPAAVRPRLRIVTRSVVPFAALALVLAATRPLAAADTVPGLRGELMRSLDDVRGKVIELAQAMPENKYSWRPEKGVRSVGEVYLHMAQGNYALPHLAGVAIPADVDVAKLGDAKLDKAATIAALTASFAHASQGIADTPDSTLDQPIKIFGHDGTVREALVITVTHAHEHLGQSIAYARSNGVVPPWTARADSAAAAKAAAKATAAGKATGK